MITSRHYEFEGVTIDVPMHYDEKTKKYIEDFPDFAENLLYTPEGCPVMFSGEDACELAEEAEPGGCPSCACCKFYRPAGPHTLIGVCSHGKFRKKQADRA